MDSWSYKHDNIEQFLKWSNQSLVNPASSFKHSDNFAGISFQQLYYFKQ